jgi:hypothetical protein
MSETYERKSERKFCYFTKDYVFVVVITHRWQQIDGKSWGEEEMGFECPNARKCRRAEHNCICIHPKTGTDPFIPFRNLLADMW